MAYPSTPSSELDPALSLLTVPVLAGLVLLRYSQQTLQQIGQFSESLIQGEQLPILERCSSAQNKVELGEIPYRGILAPGSSPIHSQEDPLSHPRENPQS